MKHEICVRRIRSSPPVTDAKTAVIAGLDAAQRAAAKQMHAALVIAFSVAARDKGRIGPAGFRTLWVETLPDRWIDRAPDRTPVSRPGATIDEMALADLVIPALMVEFASDRFHAELLIGRALGVPWGRIMRTDPKVRGERMLKYLHQWLLYRLWVRLQNKLQTLLPRLQKF